MNSLVKLSNFMRSRVESGATVAEYALMIAGIAVALVAATVWLGGELSDAYVTLTDILF